MRYCCINAVTTCVNVELWKKPWNWRVRFFTHSTILSIFHHSDPPPPSSSSTFSPIQHLHSHSPTPTLQHPSFASPSFPCCFPSPHLLKEQPKSIVWCGLFICWRKAQKREKGGGRDGEVMEVEVLGRVTWEWEREKGEKLLGGCRATVLQHYSDLQRM